MASAKIFQFYLMAPYAHKVTKKRAYSQFETQAWYRLKGVPTAMFWFKSERHLYFSCFYCSFCHFLKNYPNNYFKWRLYPL